MYSKSARGVGVGDARCCSLPFAARLTNYSNSRVTFYGSHLRNYLLLIFDALPGAYHTRRTPTTHL